MSIDIHFHPRQITDSLTKVFQEKLSASWITAAVYYYGFVYSFAEREQDEEDILAEWKAVLMENIPPAFAKGIHLLQANGGMMGEDIYLVDGEFQHTMQLRHVKCDRYSAVIVDGKPWCCNCGSRIPEEEIGD